MTRVGAQIAAPIVQPLGLIHTRSGTLSATARTTATIDAEVTRAKTNE